jgi:hypothetical protein
MNSPGNGEIREWREREREREPGDLDRERERSGNGVVYILNKYYFESRERSKNPPYFK